MHRRIRLTGRKQLSKSSVRVRLMQLNGDPLVTMTLGRPDAFWEFPTQAKLSLVLQENKGVEVVDFGTVGRPHSNRSLKSRSFVSPTCQLRVADPGLKARGLLLASTDSWTLRGDDADEQSGRGILSFQAYDTAPQSWKLELRPDDYPLVMVDQRIPAAANWARTDPVFVAVALPAIVGRVFDSILRGDHADDTPWVADWLQWSDVLLPGDKPPLDDDDGPTRTDWIERLLDQFCSHHGFADQLLAHATPEENR